MLKLSSLLIERFKIDYLIYSNSHLTANDYHKLEEVASKIIIKLYNI